MPNDLLTLEENLHENVQPDAPSGDLGDSAAATREANGDVAPEGLEDALGALQGARCKCGAGQHQTNPQICAKGHAWLRNTRATKTLERALVWWQTAEPQRRKWRRRYLQDVGLTERTASGACFAVADAAAMATVLLHADWDVMVERGGGTTPARRRREVANGWERASQHLGDKLAELKARSQELGGATSVEVVFGGRYRASGMKVGLGHLPWLPAEKLKLIELWHAEAQAAMEAGEPLPIEEAEAYRPGPLPAPGSAPGLPEAEEYLETLEITLAPPQLPETFDVVPDDGW
jgi:hypothetical protein